ncbi:hypothetical protein A2U01_0000064 [Trifolium medium]|uniref:Uncharacterized protein n=1 Tax=Trifolium medium TaxID=97028 RepID=A0A392LWH8_9FABA|nr:hypothetical protein [Trifolium medium]
MASTSAATRNEVGEHNELPRWFETKIIPDQETIVVCPKWLKKYSDHIDFRPTNVILFYKGGNTFKIWANKKFQSNEPRQRQQSPFREVYQATTIPVVTKSEDEDTERLQVDQEMGHLIKHQILHTIYKKLEPEAKSTYKTSVTILTDSEDDDDDNDVDMIEDDSSEDESGESGEEVDSEVDVESDDDGEIEDVNDDGDDDNDEEDEDIDAEEGRQFKVLITEAIAYSKQHIPNKTSKYVLDDDQDHILLRDEETGWIWRCKLKTSNRYKYERYLRVVE